MTDTELLKRKIDESGLKMNFIAQKIGLSRSAFYNKVNGATEFTQSEINDLCDILKIKSMTEKSQIFFKRN